MLSWMLNFLRAQPYAWIILFVPCAGLLPLLVYTLTVSATVYPGESAYLTAVAGGIQQHSALTQPLFTQLMHAVAQVPFGSLPLRLNLTCCILAALTAMLFYRFVAHLIYLFAYDNPGGSAHIVWDDSTRKNRRAKTSDEESDFDDDTPSTADTGEPDEYEQHHQRAVRSAAFGSLAATAFFCFSAPFWIAATHLFPEPLHYMLILVMFNLALDIWHRKRNITLFTCAFLAGLIWVENPITALCSLGVIIYCIVALAKEPLITWDSISSAFAGLLLGLVFACAILGFTAVHNRTIDTLSPLAVLLTFARDQLAVLREHAPDYNWITAAAFVALPSLLALVLIKEGFQRRSWLILFAEIVWLLLLIPTMINIPQGLWQQAQQQTNFPVLVFFILAVQIGILVAIGHHMHDGDCIQNDAEVDDYEYHDNAVVCKIGYVCSWPLLFLALTTACWYYNDVQSENNAFADRIAHNVVQQLGTRDWIVDDSLTPYHLPIAMQAEQRALYSISVEQPLSANQNETIARFLATDPALHAIQYRLYNALDLSAERFLSTWLTTDPHACERIAFVKNAAILRKNGYDVLAKGFLLVGKKNVSDAMIHENVKTFQGWVDTIAPLLQTGTPFPVQLHERCRQAACEQISLVANELAYLLVAHDHKAEALRLLQRAHDFDANNISAAVNYHYLVSTATNTTPTALAETQLKKIAHTALQRCPTDQQVQNVYGTLINTNHYRRVRSTYWVDAEKNAQEAITYKTLKATNAEDKRKQQNHLRSLIKQSIATYRMDQADQRLNVLLEIAPNDTFAWVTRMMIALNKRDFSRAEYAMQKAKMCGAKPADLLCYEAHLLVSSNQLTEARTKLEKQLRETSDDIRLWEILSKIVIQQKEFGYLDNRIYPAVRNATNMEEHYLQYLIRAHVLLFRSPEQYTAARILLQRAITLNPLLSEAWLDLFRLDESLENPVFCEADAKALLRQEPTHPFATYLLGRARLIRGEFALANDLFDQASTLDPSLPEAYAGLAEVKLAQKQPAEARQLILKAFSLDRTNTRVHCTLLNISLASNQLDLADQLVSQKVINIKEPYIQLLLAHLQLKKGAVQAAQTQLEPLLKNQNNLPPHLVTLLNDLVGKLAQQKDDK